MKLEITKDKEVKFQVQIEGANVSEVTPRLILKENGYSIAIDGRFEQNNDDIECSFRIPKLDNIITQKQINAQIEVIYEDQYAIVWDDVIEIHKPLKVTMKEATIINTEKKAIKEKIKFDDIKVINESNESVKNKTIKKEEKNTFDFESIINEYEKRGNDIEYLKEKTYDKIKNSSIYEQLSKESKEKLSILKSPRVKNVEIFYDVTSNILDEMIEDFGIDVII